nr:type II toxin-antitoxin system RelE/ParE family toxin [Treponema socranskii]
MGYAIEFYTTKSGRNPVKEFIQSLQKKQIAKILRDITLLQEVGRDLHYPYVDFIKGDKYSDLMELRTKQSNTIFRTFYFVVVKDEERKEEKAVLLHAIQKKTDKTPQKELETALARMKAYSARG